MKWGQMMEENDQLPLDLNRSVTDELYAELMENVAGEKVVGLALWEESLADGEDELPSPRARAVFDLDLYLENQLSLELYGTFLFSDPDADPLQGLERIGTMLSNLIEAGIWLDEIAVTEEDDLVLILSQHRKPRLYLNVGGWTLAEWESLPSDDQS